MLGILDCDVQLGGNVGKYVVALYQDWSNFLAVHVGTDVGVVFVLDFHLGDAEVVNHLLDVLEVVAGRGSERHYAVTHVLGLEQLHDLAVGVLARGAVGLI